MEYILKQIKKLIDKNNYIPILIFGFGPVLHKNQLYGVWKLLAQY